MVYGENIRGEYLIFLIVIALTACGVPQSEHDAILAENIALKTEINELKNGEDRLTAIINQSFEAGEYSKTKEAIAKIETTHPQSDFIKAADNIALKISQIEKAQATKMEAEAKERERLANLNNTGIWQVTTYVDDFGEPTPEKYIRNRGFIKGFFSNTATQNSDLNVRILIYGPNEVAIILYEYERNNPVKAYSPDDYRVLLQGNDQSRQKLKAVNYGDRISFGPKHSKIVFDELNKGGKLNFISGKQKSQQLHIISQSKMLIFSIMPPA